MMHRDDKRVCDSKAQQVQIVLYSHVNSTGRLFGGQLMQWIDIVSSVVARRHSECDVITAGVDHLSFLAPAFVGDTVVLKGQLTHVGRTSMEVRVDTYTEKKTGRRILVNRAYVVMVALGTDGSPCPLPGLLLESEEERTEWEAAKTTRCRKPRVDQ